MSIKKLLVVMVGVSLLLFSGCTAVNQCSGKRLTILWRPYIVGPWCIELPDSIHLEDQR